MSAPASAPAASEWAGPGTLTLLDAISIARRTVAEMTALPLDAVAASEHRGAEGWRIVIDVVESAARLGDNDLLASHEVLLAADGTLTGFARLRRYRREDPDPA